MLPKQYFMSLLTGAWTLINQTTDTGSTYPNVGRLFYSSTGYVSAHVIPTDPSRRPPNITYGKPETGTDAEWALLGKYNLGYSGAFDMEVLDKSEYDDGILTHHLDVATTPSLVGRRFVRNFTVMDKGRVLRLRVKNDKTPETPDLIFWRKLE